MPGTHKHKPDKVRKHGKQPGLQLQLRHRIALSFSLLFIIITTACWLLFQNALNRSLDDYSNVLGSSLAEQTAASVRELVLVNDLLGLNVLLSQLVRDNNIAHASVLDVDGNPLSRAGLEIRADRNTAPVYEADITLQDAIAGSVQLGLDLEAVASYQERLRNQFLAILAISLVLVITTAFALAGRLTGPIQGLVGRILERTGEDAPTGKGAPVDDLKALEHTVDGLLDRHEALQERLLESGVWEAADTDEDSGPARIAASILVIKVVNINTAIELLHPATLANLMREYLFYLGQAARMYGGEINRQSGDSVMLCFTASQCGDKHSINALQCAGLFQLVMSRINARHRKDGGQMLEFRLALHSGDIFLAPELTPGGNDSVLGKTVDIAYFLSKQGRPNQMVISESACSQARNFEEFRTAGQNEISMPADNVSFMAYILATDFAANMKQVHKQCDHILGTEDSDMEDTEGQGTDDGR